ncbi:MAG: LamG-like jellyroll fold domain-containing protein, partial [Verrucomicrobiota bacterium]
GTPPTSSDVGVWDATVTAANAVRLGADTKWAGIRIGNVGGPMTMNDDGYTLTLGLSGIDMSGAAQNLTLDCIVALGNNQAWNVGTNKLALSNTLSGSGTLTQRGTGTLTLGGANIFTGGFGLTTGGVICPNNSEAFGAGTLTLSGGTLVPTAGGRVVLANLLVVTAGTTNTIVGYGGGANGILAGAITGGGTFYFHNDGSRGGLGNSGINGDISGFTGTFWNDNSGGGINHGFFDGNSPGSYDGSKAHFVTSGATTQGNPGWWQFLPGDGATFKMGDLSGTGGCITGTLGQSSGVTFEIGALNTDTTYAGVIGENAGTAHVVKVGTGTLTLTGANTYTGTTTVSGGTLWVGGSLSPGTAVIVDDNATLKVTAHSDNATIVSTGDLTLGSSGACALGFANLSSTTVAPISVANVYVNSSATINISGQLAVGQLPLIQYSSTKSGVGPFVLGPLPAGVSATLVDNLANQSVDLNVTAAPACVFTDLSGATNHLYAGATYTVSVVAGGSTPLSYLWKKNGTTPVGANSPILTLSGVITSDSGSYSVTITNVLGSVQSATNYLVVLPATGYPALVMAGGPAAYWPLNEATGPTAFDYVGRYDATYGSSGVTYGVAGPVGGKFVTLVGAIVQAPYATDLNPAGAFTVDAWLSPAATGANLCALASGHFANPRSGWLIYQQADGWNFRTYNQNGTAVAVSITGGGTPAVGNWYHVAVVWDGNVGQIYVNGVLGA